MNYLRDDPSEEEPFAEFLLLGDDLEQMMFAKRLAPDRPSSPPQLPHQLQRHKPTATRQQSTVDDTDGGIDPARLRIEYLLTIDATEPHSSPAPNRGGRCARGRGKRMSKLAESANFGRRGSNVYVDDSGEDSASQEQESDGMDVNYRQLSKAAVNSTRRSRRKK